MLIFFVVCIVICLSQCTIIPPKSRTCACINPFSEFIQPHLGDPQVTCSRQGYCYVECGSGCGDEGPAPDFTKAIGRCTSKAACDSLNSEVVETEVAPSSTEDEQELLVDVEIKNGTEIEDEVQEIEIGQDTATSNTDDVIEKQEVNNELLGNEGILEESNLKEKLEVDEINKKVAKDDVKQEDMGVPDTEGNASEISGQGLVTEKAKEEIDEADEVVSQPASAKINGVEEENDDEEASVKDDSEEDDTDDVSNVVGNANEISGQGLLIEKVKGAMDEANEVVRQPETVEEISVEKNGVLEEDNASVKDDSDEEEDENDTDNENDNSDDEH